jgi:hypothetical protein
MKQSKRQKQFGETQWLSSISGTELSEAQKH